MEIFHSLEEFFQTEYRTSLALGFFDGVHIGHRSVIRSAVTEKGELKSAVLTFSCGSILPMKRQALLNSDRQKSRLIETLGVDILICADFEELRGLSGEDFVSSVLREKLRAKKVFCGENYRFGKGASCGTEELRSYSEKHGIEVVVCSPVYDGGQPVSSTRVRRLIEEGAIEEANRLLSYPFEIEGVIERGNHIGSMLGFPTVNIPLMTNAVVPRFGVYESEIIIGGRPYRGATNIGVHPTVKEKSSPLCETFILDFDGEELYETEIRCRLIRFIRTEKKFKEQIHNDIKSISRSK